MVILTGYEHKQGEFTNDEKQRVKYDSMVLHVISNERPEVNGWAAENVRASMEVFEVLGTVKTIEEAVDHEILLIADATTESKGKLSVSKIYVTGGHLGIIPDMGNPTTAPSGVANKKKE